MKYVMTYHIDNASWRPAVHRFLDTGAPAPEGVTLEARWHSVAGRQGFLLLDSEDPSAVYRFAAEWSDLCDLAVIPVLDDAQAAAVLSDLR